MPIYTVGCECCGQSQDVFRSLSQYNDLPDCCGQMMSRRVTAASVIADISPYRSMATGEMVMGRRQHREHLKNNGLIEVGNERMDKRPQAEPKGIKADIAAAVNKVLG